MQTERQYSHGSRFDQFWVTALLRAIVVLTCAGAYPMLTGAQSRDPRLEPASAIQEAVRMLDRKEYATFLKTFVRPAELAELLEKKTLENVATEFRDTRASDLLAALRAAAKMKPTLNDDGSRAEYRFEKPFGRERRISMVKSGEYWYLR